MKNYFSPVHLIFFVFLLGVMVAFIQVELLSFAFAKLGLPPALGLMVLFLSLLGIVINLPVTRIKSQVPIQEFTQPMNWGLLRVPCAHFTTRRRFPLILAVA